MEDYNIHIPVAARDEFGELATAFNTMSDKIGERDESLRLQMDENDRLLRSILPGSTAARMKQGAADLAETHPSVSVLYAEIEGWQEVSQNTSAEESIALLNELTSALDDCSERFDVEKLQDVGSTYLAVSGLSRPRIDHEKRAVDCALAMLQVMKRFNQPTLEEGQWGAGPRPIEGGQHWRRHPFHPGAFGAVGAAAPGGQEQARRHGWQEGEA